MSPQYSNQVMFCAFEQLNYTNYWTYFKACDKNVAAICESLEKENNRKWHFDMGFQFRANCLTYLQCSAFLK